jgi:hydroxymethylglutaryl-CoA reductase
MPVGLVGGATASHPTAKAAIKILDVKTAEELAGIIAAAGLAQNFAALRVLASEGVQKGHMKLHARNLAVMAGAKDEQVGQVLHIAEQQDSFTYDKIRQIVLALQENEEK